LRDLAALLITLFVAVGLLIALQRWRRRTRGEARHARFRITDGGDRES
jgi:hypothetical protein